MTRSDCRTALWKQARWKAPAVRAATQQWTSKPSLGPSVAVPKRTLTCVRSPTRGVWNAADTSALPPYPVYLVYSCAGTNDNMTKFCTSSLLCDAVLRLSLLLLGLVGFGPKNLALLKGQRLESYSAEGSTVGNAPCHTPKSVVFVWTLVGVSNKTRP